MTSKEGPQAFVAPWHRLPCLVSRLLLPALTGNFLIAPGEALAGPSGAAVGATLPEGTDLAAVQVVLSLPGHRVHKP